MKALSIHPLYADAIIDGVKKIECRTWKTNYRGEILICNTAKKYHGTIPSHALCTVNLVDVVPFTKKHLKDALMDKMPDVQCYAWILDDITLIKPIPIKGKLGLWNYNDDIEYLELPEDEEEAQKICDSYWKPLEI